MPRLERGWTRDVLVIVFLAIENVLFFWQVFFEGAVVPRGGGDLASFLYPKFVFAAQYVSHGVLPLWNPYLYGGQPYLADVQSGLLYPPNLIALFLFRPFTYHKLELLVIAHYVLAGAFAYVFARQIGASRFGALVTGLVWQNCGFLVAHLGHYNLIAVVVWLPLALALLDRALHENSHAWAVGGAMALAVSTLGGHTQLTLYGGVLIVAYAAAFAIARRQWVRPIIDGLIVCAGAVVLDVVQLWPAYQLNQLSLRAEISYPEATAFEFLPQKLILFLVPHFYGATGTSYWGPPSLTENFGYVGIVTLALVGLGLVVQRDWRTRAFALFTLVGLLLAFGDWTPVHGWLFALVPGFDKVRAPGRFLFFVDLGLAVLAGRGADMLTRPLPARRRALFRGYLTAWAVVSAGLLFVASPIVYLWLFQNRSQNQTLVNQIDTATSSFSLLVLFALAALFVLIAHRYRWLPRTGLMALVAALIVVDLGAAGSQFNPTTDNLTAGFQHPAVVNFLKTHLGDARIDSVTGVEDIWQPNTAQLDGFRSVWGLYDPFVLSDYYWYWKSYIPGRTSGLYDLLGVRYVLGHKNVVLDQQKFQKVFDGDPSIDVFENKTPLPRAFVVDQAIVVSSHDAALKAIQAKGFDPSRTVVIEGSSDGPSANASDASNGNAASIAAKILDDGPNRVTIEVSTPHAGYLVLSDAYYPGWQVFVDNKPQTLFRADWTFRAVQLNPGTHRVEFLFRPRSIVVGGVVSAVAWILSVAYVGLAFASERRRSRKVYAAKKVGAVEAN